MASQLISNKFGDNLIRRSYSTRNFEGTAKTLAPGQTQVCQSYDDDSVHFGNGGMLTQVHQVGQSAEFFTVYSPDGKHSEEIKGHFEVTEDAGGGGLAVHVKGAGCEQEIRDDGRVAFRQAGNGATAEVATNCVSGWSEGGYAFLSDTRDIANASHISQVWIDPQLPGRLQLDIAADEPGRANPQAGGHAEIGLLVPWNVFTPTPG